jgi:hypothetical protein
MFWLGHRTDLMFSIHVERGQTASIFKVDRNLQPHIFCWNSSNYQPDFNANHHSHNKQFLSLRCFSRWDIRSGDEEYTWGGGPTLYRHIAQWRLKLSALLPIENPENKYICYRHTLIVSRLSPGTIPYLFHSPHTSLSFYLHFCLAP